MRLKSQNYEFKSQNYMETYFCQIRKKINALKSLNYFTILLFLLIFFYQINTALLKIREKTQMNHMENT